MGGAVSELRHAIRAHVLIAQRYAAFLEPTLVVLFAHGRGGRGRGPGPPRGRAPDGRRDHGCARVRGGADRDRAARVMQTLLRAVAMYRSLALAPNLDPLRRWYDPPWRSARGSTRPMPRFLDIRADEVARFQIAVLRRARAQLEALNGPQLLNNAVLENALDDFVRNDVKAIFSAVYGGENAVRRIALANVHVTVEMMSENRESAIVLLAGAKRLCQLLADANVLMYSPVAPEPEAAASRPALQEQQQDAHERCAPLFRDMDTCGAVPLLPSSLARFDVDAYLSLYFHVCRFISFAAAEGITQPHASLAPPVAHLSCRFFVFCPLLAAHNAKLVGQHGGVDGAIRLLLRARELQREKKQAERDELARRKRLQESPQADWSSILEAAGNARSAPPPPVVVDVVGVQIANLAALAVVEFTPTEVAQTAMWAFDLLATLDFNVSLMKLHRLKYVLEEIRLDLDSKELGDALIVTRRLRLIRWDHVGLPPPFS